MLTALAALAVQLQELSAEKIYDQCTASIATLLVEKGQGTSAVGTAFLALDKDLAVTAWHVVRGAKSVKARFSDGTEVDVTGVVDKNAVLDVAVVRLDAGTRPRLNLATSGPKIGSKAFVIGSPKGMDFSISDGIISQTPLLGEDRLYQFTCPVSPGNSGGPLFNSAGQVLGVVSYQLRDAQNLNFAVPFEIVNKLSLNQEPKTFDPIGEIEAAESPALTTVTDDLLKSILTQGQLTYKQNDDGTGLTAFLIETEGLKLALLQYTKDEAKGPTANLALSAGFSSEKSVDLAKLNLFNRQHRFVRAYRDQDGTVYVENDLEVEHGIGRGNLARFVVDFSETLRDFQSEVYGKSTNELTLSNSTHTAGDGLLSTLDDPQLAKLLADAGLKTEQRDDGTGKTLFIADLAGVKVGVYQFTDGEPKGPTTSLTLSTAFDVGEGADREKINAFNRAVRFCKVFVDGDGDLLLVSDLDLHGGVTPHTIRAFIERFGESVSILKHALGG